MATTVTEMEKYEVLERIGSGSFGVIRKVKRKSDGYILCRKEINYIKMSHKEREQLTTEFNILSSLRHPNIVAYYHREHLKATQDLYLYMEYCGGGDLGNYIKELKETNKFAEEEFVWRVLSQLATALYRCHYGVDPPSAGSNVLGPTKGEGLRGKQAQVMILHRDLKPENIFLGADQSVKLGDFGLSKLMRSHDFASTYVGTPFYMSPEICAAEKYTHHSDIWSVGCIVYELCKKEPPFNARSHVQLVQKIREGKVPPLPDIYSAELKGVIASCLKVNPDHRPDTAALLRLPAVRLMRKEKEVSDIGRSLRTREEIAQQKLKELEARFAKFETEKAAMKVDIENCVRREWEVKARLEIDRQVQIELEKLRKKFENEVQERVSYEIQKHKAEQSSRQSPEALSSGDHSTHQSSVGSNDTDFPSSTDLSDLSLESPIPENKKSTRKGNRTPFSRAKTGIESPNDIQMAEPSPMSIASLSLSPRRTAPASSGKNLFAEGGRKTPKWDSIPMYSDDEDDIPDLPSPTRPKVQSDPFKAPRRPLLRQNTTAMMQKLSAQPNLFPSSKTGTRSGQSNVSSAHSDTHVRQTNSEVRSKSPSRRLSKIPSYNNLSTEGSPSRKTAMISPHKANHGGEEMRKAIMQRNMGGRSLVELAQARAGGRPIEDIKRNGESRIPTTGASAPVKHNTDWDPPATWDPEKDDMPSPFLARGKVIRNLR